MRRPSGQQHNIEGAFVLVLFAVFAITVIAVLALGANSYQRLVTRDNDAYNNRIITSYVAAKIRACDAVGAIEVGGFENAKVDDGVNTLHLYQDIDGETYDQRIYYYDGQVYEVLTMEDSRIEPDAGSPIIEAKDVQFSLDDGVVSVTATDIDGRINHTKISARSLLNGTKGEAVDSTNGGVG